MITFLPQNIEYKIEGEQTILQAAAAAGVNIDGNCAGAGVCGKCKIRIIDGPMPASEDHHYVLTDDETDAGYRLACCTAAMDGMVIEMPESETTASRKKKLVKLPEWFVPCQRTVKRYITVDKAVIDCQKDEVTRIQEKLPDEISGVSFDTLKKIPKILKDCSDVTVTLQRGRMIDIEEGDTGEECYGVAVDIGTTTVVIMLWNLASGEMVGINAATNPQGTYGADVISRINFAGEEEGNLDIIHNVLIDAINRYVLELCEENGVAAENIYEYAVVGNTTMSHIFLGVNPAQLAVAPFTPVFTDGTVCGAAQLKLVGNCDASVYLSANIAGHIGSDITAGIITTDIMDKNCGHLFIDIGTNGEIVLSGNGRACACSTAAGPAFEGSSIRQGMRAARGAIERVDITDEGVSIKTIGDAEPVGICGSGIIDAVGELIRTGIVNKSGKVQSPDRLRAVGMSENVLKHIRTGDRVNDFVLYESPDGKSDVLITQKDIREVQLAKAAISAGIRIMMKELGLTEETLEKVSIAGAFGSYIRNSSAISLGLLPAVPEERIYSLGNSAGIGASMMLLSEKSVEISEAAARDIQHIELAGRSDFQEEYMLAMSF